MGAKQTGTSLIAIVVLMLALVLLPCLYVGAYLTRSQKTWDIQASSGRMVDYRYFPTRWEARVFGPVAWMESLLTGVQVTTYCDSDELPESELQVSH